MRTIVAALLAAGLAASPALAQSTSAKQGTSKQAASKASSRDAFVRNATIGNMFEIESSRVALEKSQRSDVKELAQMLIDDHTKAGNDMQAALGSAGGAQMPAQLDSKHQKMMRELQGASGPQFDQKYLQQQASAHKEAIALFQTYSRSGDDQNLKQFAQNTLPNLQKHAEHVTELQRGSNATASKSGKSDSLGGGNAKAPKAK